MLRTLLPTLALAGMLALGGCGGDEPPAAEPPAASEEHETEPQEPDEDERVETAAEQDPTVLRVYFLRGEQIGTASRHVEPTPGVARAALEALLAGPDEVEREAGLGTEIPQGTRLLGVSIDTGRATVDLSREFEAGGGSLSMQARVAQVVYTLTQFPTVEHVSITLEGEVVSAIGGEGVPAEALSRTDFEDLTPQILVESPGVGDRVTSPLRVQGSADTFEATFIVHVLDAAGELVVDQFVTATSGSGVRGTFDATFRFEVTEPGMGALVVFAESAEDGSRMHEVEMPIELAAP